MHGCEIWTIKKTEHQISDAFKLWYWRRLLRVPGRSNESVLKEINPEYSLGGLMLKLKLQCFGHLLTPKNWLIGKDLILGKIEGKRRGWQRMGWLESITKSMTWIWASSGSWWWTGKPAVLQSMGSQRVGPDWATELNLTEYLCACVPALSEVSHSFATPRAVARQTSLSMEFSKEEYWNGSSFWESQFLGRLIRSPGVPKERRVWGSQGAGKDKSFFLYIT